MNCPLCDAKTKVTDTRCNELGEIVRIRLCKACGNRSMTEEIMVADTMERGKGRLSYEESI